MAFNLGNRLKGFKKFLSALNMGQWDDAAREMMDSKWATQVGKRAERLRDMVLTGRDV
jgi:lysozyme